MLTRLYTPEDFGLFAVFSALSAILAVAVGLRYEFAVPVATTEATATALVVGIVWVSLGISAIIALLVGFFGSAVGRLVGDPDLASLLWLLPPAAFLWGIGSALTFWSIRRGYFRTNGLNRIIYNAAQAGSQIGFGIAALGGFGLVIGYTIGYLVRCLHLATTLPNWEMRAFFQQPAARVRTALAENWRYPAYSAISGVLQSMCNMFPAVLIAVLYGPAMAGWFVLAQRVVALPVRLFSESASQVFLSEIATSDHRQLMKLFKRVSVAFFFIGLFGALPLIFAGPHIFGLVFGEEWSEAGIIVQLLAPLYLARFVVTPVSQTLNILKRQDIHLLSSIINGTTVTVSFIIGWIFGFSGYSTIFLYSLTSSAAFIFYIVATWMVLRRSSPERRQSQ